MNNKVNIIIAIVILSGTAYNQDIFEGYTLFSPQIGNSSGSITYLIDNDYNIIQLWEHENGPASMPYLVAGSQSGIENSFLLYPYRVDNPTMQAGGVGGGVQCLTWDGLLVWEFILSNNNFQHHHDIEPLPNGNVLLIAWEMKTASEAYQMGREIIDNPLNQMWSTAIFEIQNDGNGSAEIVWEWHLWDHLIQDYCISCPNYGVVSEHPELFNINNGDVGSATGPINANADWMHINTISYNEKWDQIVISSRYQNEIFVIDHSTTIEEAAGHIGGNFGKGGDFLYRWGNPQNYNRGNANDQILNSQHSVNWIDEDYPGSGNIILFNNYHDGIGPWGVSAVLELITPIDLNGNYNIKDGASYGPSDYIWSYDENIFTTIQGGAFRLKNGNTLITDCDSARIIEINNEGEIVWDYVYNNSPNSAIARAQKYSLNYFNIDCLNMGDLNMDNSYNILDIVSLSNCILIEDCIEIENSCAADINSDGSYNILDLVSLANCVLEENCGE